MIQFSSEPRGREAFDSFWRSLLVADWEQPDGPMRLSSNLPLSDLANSNFFFNARLFLAALDEQDGIRTTETGNLNRSFVEATFERMKLSKLTRNTIRTTCKVLNEHDLWPLHLVRVICECGGLVARRKKHFHLAKAGRALLGDDKAGALFRTLFIAYFRRFDLHYNFSFHAVPGIQQTMAVVLWRLDTVARDWKPVQGLAPDILLPGVLAQLQQTMVSRYDTEEWILQGYVLDPLFNLGLIERQKRGEWPGIAENDLIRVTSLWHKFIRFGF